MGKAVKIQKKGVALLWSLIIILVLLVIAGSMTGLVIKELRMSLNIDMSERAYAAARSGVEIGKKMDCDPSGGMRNFGPSTLATLDATTRITYSGTTQLQGSLCIVESTGVAGSGNAMATRKIRTQLANSTMDYVATFDNDPAVNMSQTNENHPIYNQPGVPGGLTYKYINYGVRNPEFDMLPNSNIHAPLSWIGWSAVPNPDPVKDWWPDQIQKISGADGNGSNNYGRLTGLTQGQIGASNWTYFWPIGSDANVWSMAIIPGNSYAGSLRIKNQNGDYGSYGRVVKIYMKYQDAGNSDIGGAGNYTVQDAPITGANWQTVTLNLAAAPSNAKYATFYVGIAPSPTGIGPWAIDVDSAYVYKTPSTRTGNFTQQFDVLFGNPMPVGAVMDVGIGAELQRLLPTSGNAGHRLAARFEGTSGGTTVKLLMKASDGRDVVDNTTNSPSVIIVGNNWIGGRIYRIKIKYIAGQGANLIVMERNSPDHAICKSLYWSSSYPKPNAGTYNGYEHFYNSDDPYLHFDQMYFGQMGLSGVNTTFGYWERDLGGANPGGFHLTYQSLVDFDNFVLYQY